MASYLLAGDSWRDSEVIRVFSPDDRFIGELPLSFIRSGGVNTWDFVLDVVRLVLEPGQEGGLRNADGQPLDLQAPPSAGNYVFWCAGECRFARGPEYFRKNIAPVLDAGQSTRSRSKSGSSINQNRFRIAVGVRDSQCLVTGVDFESCTACHIVPQSREDLYRSILGLPRQPPIFHPSSGLLLEDALHRAFDRLELSLYYKAGVFYVHFFDLGLPGARQHHGKMIPPSRFHSSPEKHPNQKLIRWHYKQCAMARIRGFAFGMEIPKTSAEAMISEAK